MIIQKEKSDGQKSQIKGHLVAKGFQEEEKPQLDSPTLLRESLKMYFAVVANEGFKLRSIAIKAAFLQARCLDIEVYMKPPRDVKKTGKIWKLKKPLYGLNDTSGEFRLKVRVGFDRYGLKILDGDEAFYYRHDKQGNLDRMISSHVDGFILAVRR